MLVPKTQNEQLQTVRSRIRGMISRWREKEHRRCSASASSVQCRSQMR